MTDRDPPAQRLFQLMFGIVPAQAVYAAAELGLADAIAAGQATCDELADAVGAEPATLERLLRYLAGLGLFTLRDGRYGLTEMGALLKSDAEGSQRATARITGRLLPAWGEILHCLRTGRSGYQKATGKPFFEGLAEDPEAAAIFDTAMTAIHGPETAAMLEVYDFSDIACLADIGGGNASLLIEVLQCYPEMHGLLVDLPPVVARSRANLEAAGLAERCRAVGGNFFETVPEGADAYLLRQILHDWDDPEAIAILANCRKALPPDGRLLVVEATLPDDGSPSPGDLFDLMMLVVPGGRERTPRQFAALFDAAGLKLTAVTPTTTAACIIEARIP